MYIVVINESFDDDNNIVLQEDFKKFLTVFNKVINFFSKKVKSFTDIIKTFLLDVCDTALKGIIKDLIVLFSKGKYKNDTVLDKLKKSKFSSRDILSLTIKNSKFDDKIDKLCQSIKNRIGSFIKFFGKNNSLVLDDDYYKNTRNLNELFDIFASLGADQLVTLLNVLPQDLISFLGDYANQLADQIFQYIGMKSLKYALKSSGVGNEVLKIIAENIKKALEKKGLHSLARSINPDKIEKAYNYHEKTADLADAGSTINDLLTVMDVI